MTKTIYFGEHLHGLCYCPKCKVVYLDKKNCECLGK